MDDSGPTVRRGGGGRRKAVLLALPLICGFCGAAPAEPFIPKTDDVVVDRLPGAGDRAAKTARGLRALLAHAPNQLDLALRVARDEMALGRGEGDPRHYGRAEAALAPWIGQPDPPPEIRLLRATLLQNRHDFDGALADLDQVIAADPANAQALLIRATVRQVRAEYDGAAADCRALAPLAAPPVVATCLAGMDGVTGRADSALETLAETTGAFMDANEPELALWSLTLRGEIADRIDRAAASETAFREAMALGRRDVYLLGAYADFLLDRDRPAAVVTLLRDETRVDPLLLRLAIAERALSSPDAEEHIADLAARFATARLRGDTIHRREEARFELVLEHRADRALALAQANWTVQREIADARILLEAAEAANRPEAAAPAARWIETNHVEDPRLAGIVARLFPGRS